VLIRVAYAGLNRADLFQVAGHYPAPKESQMVPGLEVSGTIEALGEGVTHLHVNQPVFALLTGGGYAEYCIAAAGVTAPVPDGYSLQEAAALPEALLTNWLALVHLGHVQPGQTVLITGGSSGIGTFAIPMLRELNARPIALAGSPEKQEICRTLGAEPVDYRSASLIEDIQQSAPQGVDLVLDMLGGPFIETAMQALRQGGKLISIAFLQGSRLDMNAGRLLMKNLHWMGMTLRSQPLEMKCRLLEDACARLWPALTAGRIRPVLDEVFPLEMAEKAHARMQQRLHIGKILLEVGP
jgi:NADPH2:quinone reductase